MFCSVRWPCIFIVDSIITLFFWITYPFFIWNAPYFVLVIQPEFIIELHQLPSPYLVGNWPKVCCSFYPLNVSIVSWSFTLYTPLYDHLWTPSPPPYLYLTTYLWFLSLITSQLPPSDTHTYLNSWTYFAFYLCLIIIRLLCVVSGYAPARGSRGGSILADLKGNNRTNSNIVIFNKKFLCVRMHAHISAI